MSERPIDLGVYNGPGTLILSSLAEGPKHGYALIKDISSFAKVTLGPGTLYGALGRLEQQGLIELLESDDRRRPYQLTPSGRQALATHLASQTHIVEVGLRRLALG